MVEVECSNVYHAFRAIVDYGLRSWEKRTYHIVFEKHYPSTHKAQCALISTAI